MTAKVIYDFLKSKDGNVELYCEGDYNHPADFDGVAYFSSEDFNILQQNHCTSRDMLNKIKTSYDDGYIIPYRKAIEEYKVLFEKKLFDDITKNDIYELPIDTHIGLILRRWNEFVTNYINEDKVVIFECCFIQNPVTVSMIKNNSSKDITIGYVNRLAEKIIPLEPVLIYVEQKNIKEFFSKAINERPKEWIKGFVDYYTNQGYGLYNNLKGLDGVIQILEDRKRLESDIYNSLNLNKYKFDNSEFNLDLLKEQIKFIIKNKKYL